jgi:hypothetical protein
LRIQSENRKVDFRIDEEEGIVVEKATEITSNRNPLENDYKHNPGLQIKKVKKMEFVSSI